MIVHEAQIYDSTKRSIIKNQIRSRFIKRESKETERFDPAKRNPKLLEMLTK